MGIINNYLEIIFRNGVKFGHSMIFTREKMTKFLCGLSMGKGNKQSGWTAQSGYFSGRTKRSQLQRSADNPFKTADNPVILIQFNMGKVKPSEWAQHGGYIEDVTNMISDAVFWG
jgi:hypothetical protein